MIQEREEQIEKAQREIERLTAFSDDEIQNKITDLEMEIVAKNQQIEEQTEENEVLKKEIVQLSAEIQRSQAEASQVRLYFFRHYSHTFSPQFAKIPIHVALFFASFM